MAFEISLGMYTPTYEEECAADCDGNETVSSGDALEIFENGLPLAYALKHELPEVSLFMLRERITATPLEAFGNQRIQGYARHMAEHLTKEKKRK